MTVFHKTEPWWFEQAKDLTLGGSRRIGDSQKVSFNGRGYFLWDFRDQRGENWEPTLTLGEKLAQIAKARAAADEVVQSALPPAPAQYHPQDWPAEARLWLHTAGFTNDDITKLGAYWNARLERVVLPFVGMMGGSGWMARKIKPALAGPKYLFPKDMDKSGGAFVNGRGLGFSLVVTEDLLSAYKVSQATGMDAVACLGTSLCRAARTHISNSYMQVYVWLDPDAAGQKGARVVTNTLGALGLVTARVSSQEDPKMLDKAAILRAMKGAVWQS